MPHNPSQDGRRRQLAALEQSLANLAAAGVDETLLAPMRQQADALRQLLIGRGVQVAGDQTIHGDLVLGDKIGRQIKTGGRF